MIHHHRHHHRHHRRRLSRAEVVVIFCVVIVSIIVGCALPMLSDNIPSLRGTVTDKVISEQGSQMKAELRKEFQEGLK